MKRLILVMLSLMPPIAAETGVWIDLSGAWVFEIHLLNISSIVNSINVLSTLLTF